MELKLVKMNFSRFCIPYLGFCSSPYNPSCCVPLDTLEVRISNNCDNSELYTVRHIISTTNFYNLSYLKSSLVQMTLNSHCPQKCCISPSTSLVTNNGDHVKPKRNFLLPSVKTICNKVIFHLGFVAELFVDSFSSLNTEMEIFQL